MSAFLVRKTEPQDAFELAERLRIADQNEIRAALGKDPLAVLARCPVISPVCYTVVNEHGRPVAMFGITPDRSDPEAGIPWALGTPELTRNRIAFLKESRSWLKHFQQGYRKLWNYIDARNEVHIRWVTRIGFRIVERIEEFGFEKRPFYRFEWVR